MILIAESLSFFPCVAISHPAPMATPKLLSPHERRRILAGSPHVVASKASSSGGPTRANAVDQSLHGIARFIAEHWSLGENVEPFKSNMVEIARKFLVDGNGLDEHVRNLNSYETAISQSFDRNTQRYLLDNDAPVTASSFARPHLHFGKLANAEMTQLIDWNERIVVKMYELAIIWNKPDQLVDLAVDIMIGAAMGDLLVLRTRYVVSPHMTFQLDWFPGLTLKVGKNTSQGAVDPTRDIIRTQASQYVVVERSDMTLRAFLDKKSVEPHVMRSLMWQLLYTLDASYAVGGYAHGDLHLGNIMVRDLNNEPLSPYKDKKWMYVRAHDVSGGPSLAVLGDHANFFLEVIDYGRSRVYCPVTPFRDNMDASANAPVDAERVLIGNPLYVGFGIHADETFLDRSWDVRRLFSMLLYEYDLSAYGTQTTDVSKRAIANGLKALFVIGANMPLFVLHVLDNEAHYEAEFSDAESKAAMKVFFFVMHRFAKIYLEPHRDTIVITRTFVAAQSVAIKLYDQYMLAIRQESLFTVQLESDLLNMTLGPNPDFVPLAEPSTWAPRASKTPTSKSSSSTVPSQSPSIRPPGSPIPSPEPSPSRSLSIEPPASDQPSFEPLVPRPPNTWTPSPSINPPSSSTIPATIPASSPPMSTMHRRLSASTLLTLPLFDNLAVAGEIDNTVLVGLVSAQAADWKKPLNIADPFVIEPFRSQSLDLPGDATAGSTVPCAVCHKSSRGYGMDTDTRQIATDVPLCSAMCMNIHLGAIPPVLPYQ